MANEVDNELVGTLSGASTLAGTLTIPERLKIQANKNITPTTSSQEVGPDTGYDAMAQVTVGAIRLENKTVTPSDAVQTISAGENYDGLGVVTVEAASGGDSKFDFVMYSGSATQIPGKFFKNNVDIKSFTMDIMASANVGANAFDGCTSLVSAKFRTIILWGANVFANCTALKDIWLGTNSLDDGAFSFNSDPNFPDNAGLTIHVPAAYLEDYKAESALANYVDKIVGDYVIS